MTTVTAGAGNGLDRKRVQLLPGVKGRDGVNSSPHVHRGILPPRMERGVCELRVPLLHIRTTRAGAQRLLGSSPISLRHSWFWGGLECARTRENHDVIFESSGVSNSVIWGSRTIG